MRTGNHMAWDVPGVRDSELGCLLPGHLILLARSDIYIINNLVLEELANTGNYCFDFFCMPLKFVGVTGSPARPVAMIPGGGGDQ